MVLPWNITEPHVTPLPYYHIYVPRNVIEPTYTCPAITHLAHGSPLEEILHHSARAQPLAPRDEAPPGVPLRGIQQRVEELMAVLLGGGGEGQGSA